MICGEIVESKVPTIFKVCKCGKIHVAGGKDDLIRMSTEGMTLIENIDYKEMSIYLLNE